MIITCGQKDKGILTLSISMASKTDLLPPFQIIVHFSFVLSWTSLTFMKLLEKGLLCSYRCFQAQLWFYPHFSNFVVLHIHTCKQVLKWRRVHEFQQLNMKKETYDIQMPRMMPSGKEYMYHHRSHTQRVKRDMRQDKNLVKAIYIVLPIIKHQITNGS